MNRRTRLIASLAGMSVFGLTASVANAITVSGSWTKATAPATGGTVTVTIKGASDPYDKIQLLCKAGDLSTDFTVGPAGWSAVAEPDFLVDKSGKIYCVFMRSSSTTSDQTVTITTTEKRGGGGSISVGLGADPKSITTKTGQDTLASVGACELPSGDCVCDISEEACTDYDGGTYLGDDTACSGTCIPTVSEWGLVAMALLVFTAATVVIQRRRAVVTA